MKPVNLKRDSLLFCEKSIDPHLLSMEEGQAVTGLQARGQARAPISRQMQPHKQHPRKQADIHKAGTPLHRPANVEAQDIPTGDRQGDAWTVQSSIPMEIQTAAGIKQIHNVHLGSTHSAGMGTEVQISVTKNTVIGFLTFCWG